MVVVRLYPDPKGRGVVEVDRDRVWLVYGRIGLAIQLFLAIDAAFSEFDEGRSGRGLGLLAGVIAILFCVRIALNESNARWQRMLVGLLVTGVGVVVSVMRRSSYDPFSVSEAASAALAAALAAAGSWWSCRATGRAAQIVKPRPSYEDELDP